MKLSDRIAEILRNDIRLVASGVSICEDCGDALTWKVKDGCIEQMASTISELVFSAIAAGDIGQTIVSAR